MPRTDKQRASAAELLRQMAPEIRNTPQQRAAAARVGQANTGRKQTPESNAKRAEAHRRNWHEVGADPCGICGAMMKHLCRDHNHSTGKERGRLCHSCNVALGHFKDNPVILQAALLYLDLYS